MTGEIHHNEGLALSPERVESLFREAQGGDLWVFVRLFQDPDNLYLGRVLSLRDDGPYWVLGTKLAFHADPVRYSVLGSQENADEVMAMVITESGVVPARQSLSYAQFLREIS